MTEEKTIFEKVCIFESKTKGYHCYRIPALVRTKKGTLMAFCEARQRSCSDWAHSAIIAKRCEDPVEKIGQWSEQFVVKESQRLVEPQGWDEMLEAGRLAEERGLDQESDDFVPKVEVVTNNPVPIMDEETNAIHLIYCDHYDHAYYAKSTDDGQSWSDSTNITNVLKEFRDEWGWNVIAAGPGHGLQLQWGEYKGRILVPFWMAANKEDQRSHNPSEVGIIYSDDHGKSWNAGEMLPFTIQNPNESQLVQLADGRVMISSRHAFKEIRDPPNYYRAFAYSEDGANDWTTYSFNLELPEPVCLGSINRFSPNKNYDLRDIIFVEPLAEVEEIKEKCRGSRKNLAVWFSEDEGITWSDPHTLEHGGAAYSDLAVDDSKGIIYCLFEDESIGGSQGPYNGISIIKFNKKILDS